MTAKKSRGPKGQAPSVAEFKSVAERSKVILSVYTGRKTIVVNRNRYSTSNDFISHKLRVKVKF